MGSNNIVHGILVSNSPSVVIEKNLVSAPSACQTCWWLNAIRVETCNNSKVIYNRVENIGRGLFFGNACNGTQIAKNIMKNNLEGLLLNWAVLGYQLGSAGACKASENQWQGTVPSWGYNIYALNSNGALSPMNILPSTNSAWVTAMKTPANMVSGFSAGTGFSAVPVSTCNTLSGYTGTPRKGINETNSQQLLELTEDKVNFPVNDASTKWWLNYNLYNQLQEEAGLLDEDSGLKSFANKYKASNLDKIYKVNESIDRGDYAAAKSMVVSFTPTNEIEQYLKEVYSISIADRETNSILSEVNLKRLQAIAKLCPYESGPAVYNARALLTKVDQTVYFNACEMPNSSSRIQTNDNSIAQQDKDKVIIYPNPASDKLHIAVQLEADQKGQLSIYDITGKLLISETISGNSTVSEISTASLSEGIYMYKLTVNDVAVKSGKLSIIR